VHTGEGAPLERATVVMRNGLIEAVGPGAAIPAGAWVVEGAGLWVYPGLIDALSTWGIPPEPAPAPGPVPAPAPTPVGQPPVSAPPPAQGPEDRPQTTSWLHAADLVRPSDARIAAARSGGFTTAVVFPTAGIFAGQGAALNMAGERAGEMLVAGRTATYVSLATRGFTSFPGSLMGAIAYVRQVYIDADFYQAEKKAYEANPRGRRRPDYDRALEGVLAAPRVLLPASRKTEIERMIRFAAELKRPAALYGGHEAYGAIEALRAAGLPVLLNLKWPEWNKDADPEVRDSLRTLEFRERAPGSAQALARAGVRFAFYSGGIDKPAEIRKAVKKAIDAGLSTADAIRALTLSAAEIHGFADRAGSIEPGKIANLVAADGDLFQEKTKIRYVFVDGVKYEPLEEASGAKEGQ